MKTLLAPLMTLLPIPVHNISSVISELQRIFNWCRNNHMGDNPGKYHVILRSDTQRETRFLNTSIASSLSEKLFGITLDPELKTEEHINKICSIVNKKLHCIRTHMSLSKRKMLLRAFIESQFSYCPLIWMFHSKILNKKNKPVT